MLNPVRFIATWIRRSLENPNISLQDPAAWEENGLLGAASAAGIPINRDTALRLDALWRGVNLLAAYCGRLPLLTYQVEGKGWNLAKQHPAYKLLKRSPCPGMTARNFKKALTAHAVLSGAGYAYIFRDNNGTPLELWPLKPEETFPVRFNGQPWYVTHVNGEMRRIPASDMLVIMGLSHDGWTPYSIFDKARDSLGLGLAQEKYAAKFFSNNAEPRVVIQVPAGTVWKEGAQKEFLAQWNAMHCGLDASHRTAILTGGAVVNPFSINAAEAQLLESRKFTPRAIANWLGIPPHKLGDDGKAAYASLEQENQSFLDDGLEDWFSAWEDECELKLLREKEKDNDSHKIEFLRRKMLRPGFRERAQGYTALINSRILNPNEARAEEGWNPYDGGDAYLVPLNTGKPGGAPAETDKGNKGKGDGKTEDPVDVEEIEPTRSIPAAVPAAVLAAHRALIVDTCQRAVNRLAVHGRRAAEKPESFLTWLDGFRAEHEPIVRQMLAPSIRAAESLWNGSGRLDPIVEQIFSRFRDGLLEVAGDAKRSELAAKVGRYIEQQQATGPEALASEVITALSVLEPVA
jgi:HK97 family phage portal protein